MANRNHLKILNQGIPSWNEWRERYPKTRPDLSGVDLSGMDLKDGNFRLANLKFANLSRANLDADFVGADLGAANLENSWLDNADLGFANLTGARLKGADFGGAMLVGTVFAMNDLSQVKGLNYVSHFGPSSISIDTIYHSKGKISKTFLREAGVPESFITSIPLLLTKPSKYYDSFISFAEADDEFAEKLYLGMRAKGIKCWRWKEDAKWGEPLMKSIDSAIRRYEKLVVCCSRSSLNSPAVIREIERALQREDELASQGKPVEVLFPIRLDDYVLTKWKHYRKADVVAKHMATFVIGRSPRAIVRPFNAC